jgi:uncharacterized protein YcfL
MLKRIILVIVALILYGCSSSPTPTYTDSILYGSTNVLMHHSLSGIES